MLSVVLTRHRSSPPKVGGELCKRAAMDAPSDIPVGCEKKAKENSVERLLNGVTLVGIVLVGAVLVGADLVGAGSVFSSFHLFHDTIIPYTKPKISPLPCHFMPTFMPSHANFQDYQAFSGFANFLPQTLLSTFSLSCLISHLGLTQVNISYHSEKKKSSISRRRSFAFTFSGERRSAP